jgi:hypothetical protein
LKLSISEILVKSTTLQGIISQEIVVLTFIL